MSEEDSSFCPVCKAQSDKVLPNDEVQRMICNSFGNPEKVTDEILSIAEALIYMWKNGKARHCDEKINIKLKAEEITGEGMEHVKQYLVSFVTVTDSTKLFRDTIRLLSLYKDPTLTPLYQGWLNKYMHNYLAVGSTVNELVTALESTGEIVRENDIDKSDWNSNFDSARNYMITKLNIII